MDKIIWHTEKRKIKDLIPFDSNPRQISKVQLDHLKESLRKFDYCELVAIQPDNTLIAGHMRIKAMLQLGWGSQEIEVRVPNRQLELHEAKEYLIRSNKNTGEFDYDILGNEWDSHDLLTWGFSPEELGISLEVEKTEEEEKNICITCGKKIRKKKNET